MSDMYVVWYDDYGNSHNSTIYGIDSVRDRFLVLNEDRNFRWVFISDCEVMDYD